MSDQNFRNNSSGSHFKHDLIVDPENLDPQFIQWCHVNNYNPRYVIQLWNAYVLAGGRTNGNDSSSVPTNGAPTSFAFASTVLNHGGSTPGSTLGQIDPSHYTIHPPLVTTPSNLGFPTIDPVPAPQASLASAPNQCLTCRKTFSRPSRLRDHQNTHSGARPYVCGGRCGQAGCLAEYSSQSILTRHLDPLVLCKGCDREILRQNISRHRSHCTGTGQTLTDR